MGFLSAATVSAAALAALLPGRVMADKPYHTNLESYQEGDLGEVPIQGFHSAPNIKAAVYQVNYWDPEKIDTDSPYMFMAGKYGKWGPSIYSSKDLSLIWADQNYNGLAQTARTWDFRGQRVMSTYSDGRVRIYDESYDQLYVYDGRGELQGVTPDSHEAMLTANGTILMFLCPARTADLSKVGGSTEGKIADCTIQEIEPDTGEVLFQWATSDYFKPEDSVWSFHNEDVWDYCHMNAVEKTPEGNYLVSYRQLSTVIMIDGKTKEVLWVMWGKKNMFTDITEGNGTAKFAFQHEARVSGKNRFTLFDNHRAAKNGFCEGEGGACSRGLEVEYDPVKKTVWMVNEWYHPQSLISASRGGVQRTPNGNIAVAWGQNPMYTEYTADGELAMDIQRGRVRHMDHGIFDVITYRIWKGDWEGNPSWGPNISCSPDETGRAIHVSWNGATKVDKWVLLMSDNTTDLNGADKVAAQSPRNGFETQFKFDNYLHYARIAALDSEGRIIGSTPAVDTSSRKLINLDYNITEVTLAGSKSIPGVPSSSAVVVSVPTGPAGTDPSRNTVTSSLKSPVAAGGVFGGFVICVGAVIGLVFWARRRRARKSSQAHSETSYGLLMTDRVDDHDDVRRRHDAYDKEADEEVHRTRSR